jgi:hypothetical protein
MPIVELIPLNKGNRITLDNTIITTIGRTSNIGCLDKKISRNHAKLFIKSDETVWIKPIHHNPIFYKTKTNQIVSLTKDKEYQLYNNDQFGLLPDEYFYRVSIKSNDEEIERISNQNQTIDSSTVSKSPIKENEISTMENHDEEKSESISNTTRTLPTWMSDGSASTSTCEKKLSKQKTASTPSVKEPTRNIIIFSFFCLNFFDIIY